MAASRRARRDAAAWWRCDRGRSSGACRVAPTLPRRALRPPRLLGVLVELVLEAVDQRLPARLDHIERHADRPPAIVSVARLDQHAHRLRATLAAGQHAHLVVEEPHLLDARVE